MSKPKEIGDLVLELHFGLSGLNLVVDKLTAICVELQFEFDHGQDKNITSLMGLHSHERRS